jgi:polar amino acid transport system substrate-binding protein
MVVLVYIGLIACAIVFFALLSVIFFDFDRNPLEFKFASLQGKAFTALIIISFIGMVTAVTVIAMEKTRADLKTSLELSLETVLQTTHESIRIWVNDQKNQINVRSRDPKIIDYVSQLTVVKHEKRSLLNAAALTKVREFYQLVERNEQQVGFFVVSPNGINLASMRDQNIGDINPILIHRPELFARVLNGESVFVHAIPSDVPIEGQLFIKGQSVPPTMFFASPVLNNEGRVMAALVERFNPANTFSRLLLLGRLGYSGETYAFNSQGLLISESRFIEDLRSNQILGESEQGILSIEIVEPQSQKKDRLVTRTVMAQSALQKIPGRNLNGYKDYRGISVVGVWLWDDDLELGLATEQDVSEAYAPFNNAKFLVLVVLSVISVLASCYTLVILRFSTRATSFLEEVSNNLERRVSERTQALTESERLLQRVVDTVPAPIFMKNTEGVYQLVNAEFERVMGVTRGSSLGKTDFDLIDFENAKKLSEIDEQVFDSGKSQINDVWLPQRDGTSLYFQSFKDPIIESDGRVSGLAGVSLDITEREKVERVLKDTLMSLSFVQYAVDNAAYLVIWADAKTGRLLYGNQMAEALLATDQEGLLELYLADVDPSQATLPIAELVEQLRVSAKTYESTIRTNDNTQVPVEITQQVVSFGDEERIVCFARDISGHKQLEKELLSAKDRAEEGNRAKSEFLASMSHEIRTPLNGVLGMIGLARSTKFDNRQDEQLSVAQDSANSLLSIINDLLDFSKVEAQKLIIEQLNFDAHELFESIVKSLAYRAEEKGLEMTLDVSGMSHSVIKADPTRIRQVVVNLLSNAIKFTEFGTIKVNARTYVDEQEQLRLECHVIDSGTGIEESSFNRVFESFTQADTSTTRKYGGTGLGLAISQRLCRLMNGDIKFESEIGKGSDFYFDIQVTEADENVKTLPEHDLANLRVLVVDDIESNRIIFRFQLESFGIEVFDAASAEAALALMDRKGGKFFSVLLIDLNMPNMNGLELSQQIRENNSYENTKIILLTSTTDDLTADSMFALGVNGYFSKPVSAQDLRNVMKIIADLDSTGSTLDTVLNSQYLDSLSRLPKKSEALIPNVNQNLKLLLVEDNKVNQMIVIGFLENLNLTCDCVYNGEEALNYLNAMLPEESIDLILMDCQMPVMDGYTASKKIRNGEASERFINIPIVAITAHALSGDREKCLASGMTEFLTKPLNEDEFKELISRYSKETMLQEKESSSVIDQNATPFESNEEGIRWPSNLLGIDSSHPPSFSKYRTAYLAALKIFIQQAAEQQRKLQEAYSSSRFEEIQNIAHSLKGSSANLGFLHLTSTCAELEHSIRDNQNCTALQLSNAKDMLEQSKRDAQAIVRANNGETLSDRSWRMIAEELVALLNDDRVVNAELINELSGSVVEEHFVDDISVVIEKLNSFEYDEALERLKKLLN